MFRNPKLLNSVVGFLVWGGMVLQLGLALEHYPLATLLWRSAANGLLFWGLLYFVMGPLVESMWARRRADLSGVLTIVGCMGVVGVCGLLSVGR